MNPHNKLKNKVYLNMKPLGVKSYSVVKKIEGIRYVTYYTEKEIVDKICAIEMEVGENECY